MSDEELKSYENDIKERLQREFHIEDDAVAFVINMVASFHSTRGAALYNISDYLERKGL
jgi:hypothetical protein